MPEILAEVDESIDITATVAATPGSLTDDYNDLQNHPSINGVELEGDKTTLDLHIDVVPLAQNLVANDGTTNTSPYTLRTPPAYAGSVAELEKIVGGTVCWGVIPPNYGNNSSAHAITFTSLGNSWWHLSGTASEEGNVGCYSGINTTEGHVYAMKMVYANKTSDSEIPYLFNSINSNSASTILKRIVTAASSKTGASIRPRVYNGEKYDIDLCITAFDLTEMFGSAIASYLEGLNNAEQVWAWIDQYFPADSYDRGTTITKSLQSVQATARKVLDSNGNTVRTYPLDSDLTLRGIPKLANGQLYFDGDIYQPNGEATRRYHEFDLGAVTFTLSSVDHVFTYRLSDTNTGGYARKYGAESTGLRVIVPGYTFYANGTSSTILAGLANMQVGSYQTTETIAIRNDSCDTAEELKTALNGVHIVYELATPTTETADPYTEVQLAGSTEQFVCSNNVPVGNETFYPEDLTGVVQDLAPLPTTAGTYKLQVTVSGGVPSYSWVSG